MGRATDRIARYIGMPTDFSEWVAVSLTGLITALATLISCMSFAILIFSDTLSPFAPAAISIAIATAIIAGAVIGLGSSSQRIIAIPDDDTAPVLALLAMAAVSTLPADTPQEVMFLTALSAVVFCALVTGVGLALLGYLKLGDMARYLPYSVMGGYFAGLGWLLVLGSIRVATGIDVQDWQAALSLSQWSNVVTWVPAVLSAAAILLCGRLINPSLAMPMGIFIAILLFYGVAGISGLTPDALMDEGWLLGPHTASTQGLSPILLTSFNDISWSSVLTNGDLVATVILLSMISLLLTVSGLGLMTGSNMHINHELRVSGFANIVSGLAGGWICLPSATMSSIPYDVGVPPTRIVALIVVAVCALVLLYGMPLIAWLPKPILAGLLMYLGFSFLHNWLVVSRDRFPPLEYLVIIAIVITIAFAGFLTGVIFGLIAAIILFVINYSRTIVVRYELDGAQQKSNVERNVADTSYLQEAGEQMQIMKLQGYMFFGTVSDLEEKLNRRADDENKAPLRYAVLDFAQVTGIDSSAALSFMKMAQQAARVPYFLVLTGLQPDFRDRLERSGFNAALSGFIRFERDLDHGIEWCEEQILEGHADGHEFVPGDFLKQIDEVLATPGDGEIFRQYLELRHVQAGEVLTEQGDTSDTMFLMDTAAASVYLELDGEPHRVRRTHSGTVFGELGFYMHTPRSATVIADVEGDVYLLSHAALEKMEREHPQITAAFQTFMIRILSRRLLNTTRTLETLLK